MGGFSAILHATVARLKWFYEVFVLAFAAPSFAGFFMKALIFLFSDGE